MSAETMLASKFLLLLLSLFLFFCFFVYLFCSSTLAVFSQLAFIKHFCLYVRVLYAVYVPISGVFVWFYFYD